MQTLVIDVPHNLLLEVDAQIIGETIRKSERDQIAIAAECHRLEREWFLNTDRGTTLESSFIKWFSQHADVAEGTLYRYRNIGIAAAAGLADASVPTRAGSLEPTQRAPSGNELASAGQAMLHGSTTSEVRAALERGSIRTHAEARVSGGTIRLTITEAGGHEAKALEDKVRRVYASVTGGISLAAPEALEWGMRAAATGITDADLELWFRAQGLHLEAL